MTRFEQILKTENDHVMIAAHKGLCGGNIPPNTIGSFAGGIMSGADIIECDLCKMADGTIIMFHPGTELECTSFQKNQISGMTYPELMNDHHPHSVCRSRTQYNFMTLDEALDYMKDKCYINLDKAMSWLPDVMKIVRDHKMEEQILLKSGPSENAFKLLEEYAPDVRYLPIYGEVDECTEMLLKRKIRLWGAEIVFAKPDAYFQTDEYIDKMHKLGLKLWVNAIIFDHNRVLAGGHNDDGAILESPEKHWGWMVDRGFNIIQTDWPSQLHVFLGKINK